MSQISQQAKQHFAQKHITDAAKLVEASADERAKYGEENRRTYERFYNNLALFSGGTLALSVTFLGYLKAMAREGGRPLIHQNWLVGSWIVLFVCLAASLFWTLFNAHYGHYYLNREYAEAMKKKLETEVKEVRDLNLVNIQTPAEIYAFAEPRVRGAAISGKNAEWNKRREKFYSHVWVWSGRLARLCFLVGIGLLLLFAIKNI